MLQTILSVLADPTRRAAPRLPRDGDGHCTCELMPQPGATPSRLSRHMAGQMAGHMVEGRVADRRVRQGVRLRVDPDLAPDIRARCAATLATQDAKARAPESRAS